MFRLRSFASRAFSVATVSTRSPLLPTSATSLHRALPLASHAASLRSFHFPLARLAGDDGVDELPDFADTGVQDGPDAYEPEEEDRGAGRAAMREQQQAARELGVGGPKSKQDRFAATVKRKRAQKAASEEQKHEKARLEKIKEKARKAAAAKLAAGDPDGMEGAEESLADIEAAQAADALKTVELDKKTAKELQKKIADLTPKAPPGQKLSPAAIAAAAAIAKQIKEEALREAAIVRVNDKIDGQKLLVIDQDGKKLGVMPRAEAFRTAKAAGMDLLQVSPLGLPKDAPVVCKMLDYKLYKMQQDKKDREEAKSKRLAQREVKNVQVKAKIASGDLQTKIARMRRFLEAGHPVRLTYYAKVHDPLIFVPLFEKCVEALWIDGAIEPGSLIPTRPYLAFTPISDKKRALMFPKLTPDQRARFGVYVDEKTGVWRQRGRKTEEEREKEQKQDDDDEEDDDEDDDEEGEEETATTPAAAADSAKPTAAAPVTAPAAAAPVATPAAPILSASELKKQKQQEKKKQKFVSGPQLFSKAALQNLKRESGKQ